MMEQADRDVMVIVGRPTFDLDSARPLIAAAVEAADPTTIVAGDGQILQTPEQVVSAMGPISSEVRSLIILFASFADSRLAAAAVGHFDEISDIVLWSLPEQWTGGRLLRNSLCGANLAAYRLVSDGHAVATLHERPGPASQRSLENAIIRSHRTVQPSFVPSLPDLGDEQHSLVAAAVDELRNTNIGVIGDPPPGFEPCVADEERLPADASLSRASLGQLFDAAERPLSVADDLEVSRLRDLSGNESIERTAIEHSVALAGGAERLIERRGWNAVAVRCWPECFDEWGGAACASMALLNERGIPAACEADALGALSMRLMQTLSGAPTFLADLVDAELDRDQVVFWHCGVAPRSMADPDGTVRVQLHPNRRVPLVFDFGLAQGPVTIARISQAGGSARIVVGEGRIVTGQPFEGTSAVVQLRSSARTLLSRLFEEGLEHHFVLASGHHARLVEAVASELRLPLVHLT
jgi:hypothetical protein